jgi:hypothetical protein
MTLKSIILTMIVIIVLTISATAQSNPTAAPQPVEPKNSFSMILEGVNRYHGGVVGEIFEKTAAPRIITRYTRMTEAGSFYGEFWGSEGKRFNREGDITLGYAVSGFDFSFARFMVRGGDINQLAVTKTGTVTVKGKVVGVGATLYHYWKASKTSPPGGNVLKISASFAHSIPGVNERVQIRHNFAVGVDDNPFGLGDGITAVGHYGTEAAVKLKASEAYFGWRMSNAIAGRDNTGRRFRQSISFGWRKNWNW